MLYRHFYRLGKGRRYVTVEKRDSPKVQGRGFTPGEEKTSQPGSSNFSLYSLNMMRSGVTVMKENTSAIDECWPLRRELYSRAFQWLAVEVCINRLVWCEDLPDGLSP